MNRRKRFGYIPKFGTAKRRAEVLRHVYWLSVLFLASGAVAGLAHCIWAERSLLAVQGSALAISALLLWVRKRMSDDL